MAFHIIASLFIALASICLGLFVFLAGRNRPANVMLALYSVSVAAWSFGHFMAEIAISKPIALFWARVHLGSAIFISILFIHFVFSFLNIIKERGKVLYPSYFISFIFLLSAFTPLFVSDVRPKLIFNNYPVAGPMFILFTIFFFLLLAHSFYELIKAYKNSFGQKKNQIFYVLFASIIGFAGGSMMFLPIYNINVIPIGYYFVPAYILLAVYAIVKHRLLDVDIVIRKGLVYSTIMLIITVIYFGTLIILRELFQNVTGLNSLLATIIVLFGFAIFSEPLRKKIEAIIDKVFFKGKYDYQRTLKEFSEASVSILDLNKLIKQTLNTIIASMKLNKASLFLVGREGLPLNSPIIDYFQDKNDILFLDEASEIKNEPQLLGMKLCIPLTAKKKMIGIFALGEKLSGDSYTSLDIDLLTTLANNFAIAAENARLHENILNKEREIFQKDKLASLGTLAAGMAHEIKNPLAAIKGMAQILPRSYDDPEYRKNFYEIIPRQLDRINDIVEDLLQFGRPTTHIRGNVNLNQVMEDTLRLVERQCTKANVKVIRELGPIPDILGDPHTLSQAFLNLVLNAVDAMQDGGEINIKSYFDEGSIFVEIADTGNGISEANLKRIFDPFFTTKDRGSGLGLSVTFRIITEHEGRIDVESRVGKGTRFKLKFKRQKVKTEN